MSILLGGSDEYHFACFGIDFWGFKNTVATFNALYDLMPTNFWSRFEDTVWMKSIKNRIRTEAGLPPTTPLSYEDDIVTKYFPRSDAKCKEFDWTDRSATCNSGLVDMRTFGRVMSDTMTVDNLKTILAKYSYDKLSPDHHDSISNGNQLLNQMPNPGVETVIMFGNILKTEKEYNYDFNPLIKTTATNADFVKPSSVSYAIGDGTVITASAIAPGIKWAWEFDRKAVAGAKPIIFAEFCSNQNQAANVYQDQNSRSVSKSSYQGVACQCRRGNESNCDHVGLVSDPGVINFVINSLMDRQTASSPRMFDSYTPTQIDSFAKRCALVTDYN